MKLNLRATAALVAFALLAGLSAPLHAETHQIQWLLGHKNLDYFEEAAIAFKKTVEAGSNGNISVKIVMQADDNQSAAGAPEIAAKVAKGEAQMGHSFVDVMGTIDPRFHAFEVPYLFRGYRHMEGFFEGPLGAEMLEGMRAHDIVGLSFTYSGGASGVATTGRELRRPEDLKGLKVGVFGDEVNAAWLESVGATPVAIGHRLDEVSPLARGGQLDAVVTTWRNFQRTNLNLDFKYVNMMSSTYLVSVTYINQKFFDGLPKEYRALIMKASQEAGRIERSKTIELNENAKLDMLARGVRQIHVTEKNRARFVKALQPAYARSIERMIGREFLEKIRNTRDASEHPTTGADIAGR
jgi:TRAP-type C4-dicarboxylate transport system substrate-binding protein